MNTGRQSRFRAIVFDLDGTLVDSYAGIADALNETLVALGRQPVDLATVKKMVGRGTENLIRQAVGEEQLQEGIRVFRAGYERHHLTGTTLMREVKPTLAELQRRGITMAVASNKISGYTRGILKHLDIERFLAACYGPDSVAGRTKPDPAMIHGIIQALGVDRSQTLYVGDMTLDAESARNAEVALALVAGGGNTLEELRSVKPDYLVPSFSALLDIVV